MIDRSAIERLEEGGVALAELLRNVFGSAAAERLQWKSRCPLPSEQTANILSGHFHGSRANPIAVKPGRRSR